MSNQIVKGPQDNSEFPLQSVGIILRDKMKKNNPDKHILINGETGEKISNGKLLQLSIQLAIILKKFGVKKGDTVTIISQNNWKYLLTIISSFYVGAKVNLLNPDYTLESNGIKCFDDLFDNSSDSENFDPVEVNPKEDVSLILTSSGTSGLPKCVELTHFSLRMSLISCSMQNYADINGRETILGYLPFFHIFGNLIGLTSIFSGAKLVILEHFEVFFKIIQNYKITQLFVTPQILKFILYTPLSKSYISSIKDVLCGSSSITKDVEEMAKKQLYIKSVRQIYGMTEICGPITIMSKNTIKSGSVGKLVPGLQVKVCDTENEQPLPPNRNGEIRVKGDGLMKGYLNHNETGLDEEGFFKTGDLGYYDDDELLYVVDRIKDIIKYKGFQVSPTELENILIEHPAVEEVAVIGIPEEKAGEVPLAFVIKQPGKDVTEEELIRYVSDNVSTEKRLYGGVKFVTQIPKNSTGKILRRELKGLL
ncbi:AMP-binding domain containing protein [Asbolus verrucosus]|uniref:Luciferin 4-monooxygenase n=1 Tax=Asbolus verrucosus TaxID=1661398 RepID=A0A482WBE4_ASBVE|nr:AMP-binding domain containing protein [Asbolus verrucosus]